MNDYKFRLTEKGRVYVNRATHMLVQTHGERFAPFDTTAEYDVAYFLYGSIYKETGASPKAIAPLVKLPIWKARSVFIDLKTKELVELIRVPKHMSLKVIA